ncbi:hypothetical protein Tco_0890349 [Tanacetum coccineum]|uniref:Uncharacterized protein n=1 Tax=Tanacetum coccineum TaxID=301880 RepID=A0ABQ5C329_9ASTR
MKKAFQDMLHGLGGVNPTHAYYNGSCTSKDTEDPSWSTSFKTKRTQKTSSALKVLWKTLFVMPAPIISISSDSSEEIVPIVPADPIVIPEVGTVSVVSLAGVLDLLDYSSFFDSDLWKGSLPPVPDLPFVSPFLCSDDSEADDESEPTEQRPERHESLTVHDAEVSRMRDRVASRPSTPSGPSSHDILAPSYEFPLAPIVAPPRIHRRSTTLIRPGEAILFGRPYRTHPNGQRKLLTARKRVRPLPALRLAWRRISHHSSDHHSSPDSSSSSLSSDPSSVHSSGCDSSGQVHSGPSTRDAPPRVAPLSTPYPPTTSESSLGSSSKRSLDLSSPSSRPSRNRCRSPTASVPSPTHVSRSITPTPADILPPRKRFRGSYSSEDSEEEHMEVDTADAEAVADVGISEGVVAHTRDGVGMRVEIADC